MEKSSVLRRFFVCALAALLLAEAGAGAAGAAQNEETPKKVEEPKRNKKDAPLTAEQVAETVVLVYGSREGLKQIRRTGVERGKITRIDHEGKPEEISYERAFKRGETFDKDKIRLDQRLPQIEYSLIYDAGRVFGLLKGTPFTPRQQDVTTILSDRVHGIDALLRYKETGAAVKYVGKESQKGIEFWIIELTDKENQTTRYFVSAKSARVLWLEYEQKGETAPVKYKRSFHDYRVVQGTLVPYRSVLYTGDRQVEEARILTVTFGIKMEDSLFQTPEAASFGR